MVEGEEVAEREGLERRFREKVQREGLERRFREIV